MKITSTILSIPPYLSTTWKNIASLHVREEKGLFTLVVILQNRVQVEVPGLNKGTIDTVFEAHAHHADTAENEKSILKNPIDGPFSFNLPISGGVPSGPLGMSMQHNEEQSNLPPLPDDVLNKITTIAKAFGLDDSNTLPPSEPNCNCVYCQVARALHGPENSSPQEEVTDEDLKFKNWDVKQTADKLYNVTNPLDTNEHYSVFLGDPLGCTCGQKNCEHIRAVLNT